MSNGDSNTQTPAHSSQSDGLFTISDVAATTRDVNAQNKVGDALSRLYGKYNEARLILDREGRIE